LKILGFPFLAIPGLCGPSLHTSIFALPLNPVKIKYSAHILASVKKMITTPSKKLAPLQDNVVLGSTGDFRTFNIFSNSTARGRYVNMILNDPKQKGMVF
jgi:hypothetical protein